MTERERRGRNRGLLGSSTLERRRGLFEQELTRATSQLVVAMRDGRDADTENGLQLIRTLIIEAASYSDLPTKETAEDSSQSSKYLDLYSREWSRLMRSLARIEETASHCTDSHVRNHALNFFLDLIIQLIHDRRLGAARSASFPIAGIWSAMDRPDGNWSADDREYLLMRVRETVSFTAPTNLVAGDAQEVAILYCRIFSSMFRSSLASRDYIHARDVAMTLVEARPHRAHNQFQKVLSSAQDSTILLLLAWLLLTRSSELPTVEERALIDSLGRQLTDIPLWEAMTQAIETDFNYQIGASGWEMERDSVRGRAGGFIRIDEYTRVAALFIGLSYGTLVVPSEPSDRDSDHARALKDALERLRQGSPQEVGILLPDQPGDHLETEFQRAIEAQETARGQHLAQAALDPQRVAAFHAAVPVYMQEVLGLRALLATDQSPSAEKPHFGFNRLEQKWWFVDSYVHADPKELAEELVRGLARGEDAQVIDTIRTGTVQESVTLDQLRERIETWTDQRPTSADFIVITNSWQASSLLFERSHLLDETQISVAQIGRSKARLYRAYDSDAPFVAVVSQSDGINIQVGMDQQVSSSEEMIHSERVLTSVSPIPDDLVETLVRENQGSETEMRQRVVVKVLERFEVQLSDSRLAGYWILPEDEY